MAENPMLSLILYYFSADLKTTVAKEDRILRKRKIGVSFGVNAILMDDFSNHSIFFPEKKK